MTRVFAIPLLAACAAAQTIHWPQFRGPDGLGIAKSGAPVEFGPEKNLVWRTEIPTGHSSPVIAGDLMFLTGEEGGKKAPAERDKITTDGVLSTFAVNRQTGKIVWRKDVPRPRLEKYQPTNSAASPSAATDGRNIYVFFGDFGLISYTIDGKERWRKPLGPFNNVNGHGSSPIVANGKVILVCDQDTDSYLLALNKDTGEVAWKVERPEVTRSYVTPTVYRPAKGPAELIVPGAYLLTSYELETGRKLWWVRGQSWQPKSLPLVVNGMIYAHSWESSGEAETPLETPGFTEVCAQWDKDGDKRLSKAEFQDPKFARGFVNTDLNNDGFLSQPEWENFQARRSSRNSLVAVRVGGRGDVTNTHVAWSMQKFLPNVPSPLVYGGIIYLIKDGGVLTAADAATGKILKQGRLNGAIDTYYASPVAAGGHIYFLSQQGKAAVVKAGAEWEIVQVNDLGEEAFATPAVIDGRLYLRTRNALYCFGAAHQTR
ncbi:MAG: hypothetical protein FJW39_17790 [Acidobacteria bacterium]|nr:hypothetical protein [Acidobacteriota bacterium]